jgi:hypothetical protein
MFLGLAAVLCGGSTLNAEDQGDPLYRVTVRVTGEREETRIPMMPEGFERAAQKLTGNPDIAANPRFADLAARSRAMVWSYTYHDRMFGRPIHDEQGTRDRPFDLTLQFDVAMMNAALQQMGETPWLSPRPKLGLIVTVTDMARSYILAQDGAHGADQRESFADAAGRFALPIAFPPEAALAESGIAPEAAPTLSPAQLSALKSQMNADVVLVGELAWSPSELGWVGTWHMAGGRDTSAWSIRGVNFDAAFRDAIGGAAKRLRPSAQ